LCRVGGLMVTTDPPSASRQGERDALGGAGHLSESAAASKAVNRRTNRHALLATLAIRQAERTVQRRAAQGDVTL
jgi:hypothetical protein